MLNHNIETVARLQRAVRPSAGYARSLAVLARAAQAGLVTKSGLMVGLGEHEDEVIATMADLRSVGVSIVTIGQYLRPSRDHLPVSRYWTPEEFDRLRQVGAELGVAHVEASPLTRSSYHAREAAAASAPAERPEPGGRRVPAPTVTERRAVPAIADWTRSPVARTAMITRCNRQCPGPASSGEKRPVRPGRSSGAALLMAHTTCPRHPARRRVACGHRGIDRSGRPHPHAGAETTSPATDGSR